MALPATPDPTLAGPVLRVIRFGVFEADVRTRELRKRGVKVRLPDQPFQILALLLEHPGDVVTREDLRRRLWPADTFVDFDLSVNSAIRKLREALGDSAEHPTFIETLPRIGYRFIAPVERPPISTGAAKDAAIPPLRRRTHVLWAALGLLVLGAVLVAWNARSQWTRPGLSQAPQIQSIAVLPLANSGGDTAREYFVDGLTDAITNELTRFGMLTVISPMSARQYKRTTKPVAEIARELRGVDAVVKGVVALSGERITMTLELVHAQMGRLWTNEYKDDRRNIGELLARIARDIVAQIGTSQAAPVPARITRAVDEEAYDWFLRGLSAMGRGSSDPGGSASHFEKAVKKAPDFADAWAALARARRQALFAGPLPPLEVLPQVEKAAREALHLDDSLVQAHLSLAQVYDMYGDRAGADREARRAREFGPKTADVLAYDVRAFIRDRRFGDAVAAARQAQAIDPLDVNRTLWVARALRSARDYDGAIAELQAALKRSAPRPLNIHFQLGATHLLRGNVGAAIPQLERAVNLSSFRDPRLLAYLGSAYTLDGRRREALTILEELLALRQRQYVSSFGIAFIYDALGDKREAQQAIERAFQEYAVEFTQLDTYPPFEALVASPRYQKLNRH